jgi:hypothetical protein
MNFTIKLKDPGTPPFKIDLGAVYMYRWTGTAWVLIGEIKLTS